MPDVFGPKYRIGDNAFTIQYMQRKGFSKMPGTHNHPFYELYYLLQGERTYFINGTVVTARRGDMVIVHPYDVHKTASSQVPEFERVLINFTEQFVHSEPGTETMNLEAGVPLLPFPNRSRLLRFSLKDQAAVEQLLREMLSECAEQQPGFEMYVKALLHQLLVRMHRQSRALELEPPHPLHPMHAKISEIATYLNGHFQEEISLERVAKQFYISVSYLSRMFKKVTGFHFREYVQVIRVNEAQRLLRETQEKVLTIAERSGFEHVAHFNTTFKKLTGVSPLRYRKQQQAGTGKAVSRSRT
ncbi:helix-turn-helix transcriptional regulator [Paenibacillus rigui]|uniref:AraC family transcriptional regulator n=1 Tax=Paenibacillus rigui TaxID=554312 RepID=A0A229UHM3_9BACL|nr:AraC family transcriptional regulator [Paenibacillus rigui]OXM82795.1 AraC family transcriptional regulator [Paenibacillus rigui]